MPKQCQLFMSDDVDDGLLFLQLLSDAVIGDFLMPSNVQQISVTPHFKSQSLISSSFLIVHVSAAYNRTENTHIVRRFKLMSTVMLLSFQIVLKPALTTVAS